MSETCFHCSSLSDPGFRGTVALESANAGHRLQGKTGAVTPVQGTHQPPSPFCLLAGDDGREGA